jgi:hypothetical protein
MISCQNIEHILPQLQQNPAFNLDVGVALLSGFTQTSLKNICDSWTFDMLPILQTQPKIAAGYENRAHITLLLGVCRT